MLQIISNISIEAHSLSYRQKYNSQIDVFQFIHIVSALLFVISILSRNTPITVLTILTLVYLYYYSFIISNISQPCSYCRSARAFSPSSTTSIAYALLRRFPSRGESPPTPTYPSDSLQHQRLHQCASDQIL